MKRFFFLSPLLASSLLASPITSSWFTELSGRYARIYPTTTEENASTPVTSWTHPNGGASQTTPTYAGVSEISTTATDVYIRTTGLAFHVMGPWYGGNGNLFPNYPANIAQTASFPLTPDVTSLTKSLTSGGAIGYFVDGVAMFDSRDAFSYIFNVGDAGPPAPDTGDKIWNRDAYVNESDTFDPANAHQAGPTHHYHANPTGLRNLLNDSVNYDASSNSYTEAPNGLHSPILAWVFDGLPLYGPYGYSDPLDPGSGVRRMISGYQTRDGSNGSTNLSIAARTSLPEWITRNEVTRTNPLATNQYGPVVSITSPLGHYLEDYAYKGDLGLAHGTDFDLNEYNVRWCVTPEFPAGTWAYFSCIASDGTPVFPYNISRYYYGTVQGTNNPTFPASRQIVFEGGPESVMELEVTDVDETSGDVTLTWSSAEGGQYNLESSPDLSDPWLPIAAPIAVGSSTTVTDVARANADSAYFYRTNLDRLAPFDDTGFAYDNSIVSEGPKHNVLLLILDDWGIDASELYNSPGAGIQLADMPNLEALANSGLLFTRGYAQPICSPTRATILTGRQPYQHTVGNPEANSILPSSELTFPEIIATEAPTYGLASFGKWHLGSGESGPFDTGGWPNFTGTQSGGVPDYAAWTRIKISNGTVTDSGTDITTLVPGTYNSPYATSVQVDEAATFIGSQGTDPWVVWMGFNAPHSPFQDPAPYVTPTGGYSTSGTSNKDYYVKMLEALDHEIGRLLQSVDLATTNIIVVGDNGTPGQVDQAPAGGLAEAKGSLNEGGIHVPFFATGPDVTVTGTTDNMVHVVDLFATILELTGVNVPNATEGIEIHSNSIVPIFRGNDMADRCIIAEKFGLNAADGRALMMDDWPQYKLISFQDVSDPNDIPTYQMYELGSNGVESSTLTTPPNPGDPHEAAYNALVTKDVSLVPSSIGDTLYLQLPTVNGAAGVPGNAGVTPDTITVDGVEATYIARFDQSDVYDQYWVKCTVPDTITAPYTTATVTFPDNPNTNDTRVFSTPDIFVAP